MNCPRLDHFVRLNPNGTISRCGHMVNPPQFQNLDDLNNSQWLTLVKKQFENNQWPSECRRCQQTEIASNTSIRINSISLDALETTDDYLQVGGVLDNICNAACLTCSPGCSTRIGSLHGKNFTVVNNLDRFFDLPQDKILHLDISGGEPSYSKNYKKLLVNLPPNLKTLRVNTNCSSVLLELNDISKKGIEVTVTVSLDGIGKVHELIRWPISWDIFYKNLMQYKSMPVKLNLWTTVNVMNIDDLPNIISFATEHRIDHSYAYLEEPFALSVNNHDIEQQRQYIHKQKNLRNII